MGRNGSTIAPSFEADCHANDQWVVVQFEIHRSSIRNRPVGNLGMAKKVVKVRCAKCGHLDDTKKVELQGKSLVFVCPKCGQKNSTDPSEDFSQAAARIVKQATQNH
jgi:Zn finger protein HypA/HybF involved in hydrogenase expression